MRILVCEDNFVIALDLQTAVEDLGHVCCGISSRSDECLALCAQERPDLVLVDIDLADGPTGLDLVEDLTRQGIPSIVVSGQTARLGGETASSSARAVLPKPVSKARLRREIDALDRCAEGCS